MKIIFRLGLLVIILLTMTCTFLYVTREREEKLYVKVESITDAKGGHVTRQDMVEIMDLNVESYKLIEERQRAECPKIVYENELRDKQKKMASLRSTFFIKTFLR